MWVGTILYEFIPRSVRIFKMTQTFKAKKNCALNQNYAERTDNRNKHFLKSYPPYLSSRQV